MSNESISFHFSRTSGQKTDVGQACRHLWKISSACSRGSPITFSSFGQATKSLQARSGLSLDCSTSLMTESFSKMVASKFALFSGAENVTSTSSGNWIPQRSSDIWESFLSSSTPCPVKGPEILRGPPLLCTMPLCWRSVIGWFWQNTQSTSSSEPYKTMLNPPRPLTIGAI